MDVFTESFNLEMCPWYPSVDQETEDYVTLLEDVLTKNRSCPKFQVCVVLSSSP